MLDNRALYHQIWQRKLQDGKKRFSGLNAGSRYEAAARLVKDGNRLLDLGCGDGFFANYLAPRFHQVYGVDISGLAVKAACKLGIKAYQVNFDQQSLPFEDAYFNTVTCLDVIEHIPNPSRLIVEAARVLVPHGQLIVSTPNIRYVKHIYRLLLKGRFPRTSGDREGYDGGHIHYFTPRDVELILSKAGLKIITRRGIVPSHCLRFIRPLASKLLVREFLSAGFVVEGGKV